MTVKELRETIDKLADDILVCVAYNQEGISSLADMSDIADAILISKLHPEPDEVLLLRYE